MSNVVRVAIGLMAFGASLHATNYSGTCTGNIPAAGSPHALVGTCTVPLGQTLTIDPGATLNGSSNQISVQGSLVTSGATLSGVFVSLTGSAALTANGMTFTGTTGYVTFGAGTTGSITNSTFTNTYTSLAQINITGAAPTITGNTFTNTYAASRVKGSVLPGVTPTIGPNTMTVSDDGLRFSSAAESHSGKVSNGGDAWRHQREL